MTIIGRYITKEIGKYFGIILLIVAGIYLTVDFIGKFDNFMEVGLPLQRAILYFIYKFPLIMVQITPVGILLAVMITFGLMSKNKELLALRGSGVSLVSLTGPIARCGFAATLLMFLIAEGVMPLTASQANQIWLQEVKRHKGAGVRQSDIWLKGDESILHLKYFEPETKVAKGITFHRFDSQFKLVDRIDAETGVFQDGIWVLQDGIIQQNKDQFTVHLFDTIKVQLGFAPEDLAQAAPKPEEMSFTQLYRYVRKVEAEGYDATHYRVDLQAKGAYPLIAMIMTLIGAGLAAGGKIKEGLAGSVAYGLGLAFLYWIAFSFCLSLGYAGMLPPIIAAWGVNLISMCLAGYLLIKAE
ncbi:MAG: LPS export ABC transporter permease LptG [Desulfobacteraceae bacterium]|nr:MAG: LPS export ABC transporter permease LptG [Desulfobacteraceae bacterium]